MAERYWATVERSRRVATRYDKTDRSYLGFLPLASVMTVLTRP